MSNLAKNRFGSHSLIFMGMMEQTKLQDNYILKNVAKMANNVLQNSHAATLAILKMAIISPFFIRF